MGEVAEDCRKCHSCLQKWQEVGPRELQAGRPCLCPWEGDETNHGNHFQAHEGYVIRNIHYGFTKGNAHLTNLITFYDETTGLVDEGILST